MTFLLACMIGIASWGYGCIDTYAEEKNQSQDIDYSYLMGEGALVAYAEMSTRGVYLINGTSVINKMSSTTIGAGGTTTAEIKCRVSITSIVERYVNGKWARVTSWTQTNESAYMATVSKSLIVSTGNIYRVRSAHYANTDVSNSYTNGLQM